MNMVCVSAHHSCWAKNRWDPDLPIDPMQPPSWMLNNDPQKESDLFSPVKNPFHRLESFTCRDMWAGLRFQRWGSLSGLHPELLFAETDGIWSSNVAKLVNTRGFSLLSKHMWGRLAFHEALIFSGERKCHMQVKKKNVLELKRNNWFVYQRDKFWSADKHVTIICRCRCWSRLV